MPKHRTVHAKQPLGVHPRPKKHLDPAPDGLKTAPHHAAGEISGLKEQWRRGTDANADPEINEATKSVAPEAVLDELEAHKDAR
jgi:hypothetical protein